MRKILMLLIICTLIISLSSCGMAANILYNTAVEENDNITNELEKSKGYTIKSEDRKFSVIIPDSWTEMKDLHDEADLQASSEKQESYMIALIESKDDMVYSFEEWQSIVMESLLESLENEVVNKPDLVEIKGNPAIQYVITGTIDNLNITYLATYINGPNYYGQLLCWCLKSEYNNKEDEYKQIINSIVGL